MRVDDFDFDLPSERIALRPVEPRESARLLVIDNNGLNDFIIADLPSLLRPTDLLVFNDTKVIPAQLYGTRLRNGNVAQVEAMLHMREGPNIWRAFLRPGKRVKEGERISFDANSELDATLIEKGDGGEVLLQFELVGAALDAAIRAHGHVPIPPYIAAKRGDDAQDSQDYQTIYAREEGAVAAPTAGLHFTPSLFGTLDARGIERCFVTLHVGAGTFLPVKADETSGHKMHHEIGVIDAVTAHQLNTAKQQGRRIIAVGTTSLRLLESACDNDGTILPFAGATDIFITPGYHFKYVDGLITNFHLPRSTLFMLVSAMAGLDVMQNAYCHAIQTDYRFYSYGDACLILPKGR